MIFEGPSRRLALSIPTLFHAFTPLFGTPSQFMNSSLISIRSAVCRMFILVFARVFRKQKSGPPTFRDVTPAHPSRPHPHPQSNGHPLYYRAHVPRTFNMCELRGLAVGWRGVRVQHSRMGLQNVISRWRKKRTKG